MDNAPLIACALWNANRAAIAHQVGDESDAQRHLRNIRVVDLTLGLRGELQDDFIDWCMA